MLRYFSFLIVSMILFSGSSETQTPSEELITIISALEENNVEADEWSVLYKDKITNKQMKNLIKNAKKEDTFSSTKQKRSTSYSWILQDDDNPMTINYTIVQQLSKNGPISLIVELSGSAWNGQIEQKYEEKIKTLEKEIFTKNVNKFTCIMAKKDDIIEHVDFLNKLKNNFQIKDFSTQTDKIKENVHNKIVYGYTPLWKESINIMGQQTNLQLVINQREKAEETKIIIGTPILINEY